MEGLQKMVYEQIMDIVSKILDGFYGEGDDFDLLALEDDVEDLCNE